MAYFRTCALKKRGQVFTRVGLLVDLYSVVPVSASGCANVVMTSQYLRYLRRHLFIYFVFVNLRTRQDTTGMLSPGNGLSLMINNYTDIITNIKFKLHILYNLYILYYYITYTISLYYYITYTVLIQHIHTHCH